MPQVSGCSLTREKAWHQRLKVYYPRDLPAFSFSIVFHDGQPEKTSMRDAAVACLRWAWAEHEQATGAPCPRQLPDTDMLRQLLVELSLGIWGRQSLFGGRVEGLGAAVISAGFEL